MPGTCVLTKIASIGARLQDASIGRPILGSGSAVTFTNKGYQVSYNQLPLDIPLQRGDGVTANPRAGHQLSTSRNKVRHTFDTCK